MATHAEIVATHKSKYSPHLNFIWERRQAAMQEAGLVVPSFKMNASQLMQITQLAATFNELTETLEVISNLGFDISITDAFPSDMGKKLAILVGMLQAVSPKAVQERLDMTLLNTLRSYEKLTKDITEEQWEEYKNFLQRFHNLSSPDQQQESE